MNTELYHYYHQYILLHRFGKSVETEVIYSQSTIIHNKERQQLFTLEKLLEKHQGIDQHSRLANVNVHLTDLSLS